MNRPPKPIVITYSLACSWRWRIVDKSSGGRVNFFRRPERGEGSAGIQNGARKTSRNGLDRNRKANREDCGTDRYPVLPER